MDFALLGGMTFSRNAWTSRRVVQRSEQDAKFAFFKLLRAVGALRWLAPGRYAAVLLLAACTVSPRGKVQYGVADDVGRLEGTVARFDRLPPPEAQLRQNASLTLNVSGAAVQVELAPGWFLEQQGLTFNREQALTVTGDTVVAESGERRIVARKVMLGDRTVRLRDEQGHPLWQERASEPPATEPAP